MPAILDEGGCAQAIACGMREYRPQHRNNESREKIAPRGGREGRVSAFRRGWSGQ
jgi:hypothetical protein